MKLKLRKKKNKINIVINLICVIFVFTYAFIYIFNTRVTPILFSYAESETKKLITMIINKAVTKQISLEMDPEKIYDVEKNLDGEINIINFNSVAVTKILNSVTNLVQLNLKLIEEGKVDLLELPDNTLNEYNISNLKKGIIYEIPLGSVTKLALLSNLGPKIPVKLNLIGDVESGIRSNLKEYGINNALLEIGVNIDVACRINLPFISKIINVNSTVPIIIKVIQGKIPEYYLNGFMSDTQKN